MAEEEKKIEGYEWLTNVNTKTEYVQLQFGGPYREKNLLTSRSNRNIAKEYVDRLQVPFGDIIVTDSQGCPGMKAVYRRKELSKTEPSKA